MTDTKILDAASGNPAQAADVIPIGRPGAPNDVLTVTAQSIADLAAGGSAVPSDFQPAIVTGNYYFGPTGCDQSDLACSFGSLVAIPFWCSEDITWTRIGVSLAIPEASSAIRLGIYAAAADNTPGALILDAGTVSVATPGPVEITISQALTKNTLYYLVAECDDATDTATFLKSFAGGLGSADLQFVRRAGLYQAPIHGSVGGGQGPDVPAFGFDRAAGPLSDPFVISGTRYTAPAIWLRKV